MQDAVKALRIQPRHIYTERGFCEFGDLEHDELAGLVIEFCQKRGNFDDFLREDLEKFGVVAQYVYEAEMLNFIEYVGKGIYQLDIRFIRRAYLAGKRDKVHDLRRRAEAQHQ